MNQNTRDTMGDLLTQAANLANDALIAALAPEGFKKSTSDSPVLVHDDSTVAVAVTSRGYRVSFNAAGDLRLIDRPLSVPIEEIVLLATGLAKVA